MKESDLGKLEANVEHLVGEIGFIRKAIEGPDGLVAKTEMHGQSIGKIWKFLWLGITSVVGLIILFLQQHF